MVTLNLSDKQAETLRAILSGVAGSPFRFHRKHADEVIQLLEDIGVGYDNKAVNAITGHQVCKDEDGIIDEDQRAENEKRNTKRYKHTNGFCNNISGEDGVDDHDAYVIYDEDSCTFKIHFSNGDVQTPNCQWTKSDVEYYVAQGDWIEV